VSELLSPKALPKLGTHHWASLVCCMDFNFGRLFEARLTIESKLAALAAERAKKEHCLLLANEVTETWPSTRHERHSGLTWLHARFPL
jgi:DNA-binding FadR family transcriptional regulator